MALIIQSLYVMGRSRKSGRLKSLIFGDIFGENVGHGHQVLKKIVC